MIAQGLSANTTFVQKTGCAAMHRGDYFQQNSEKEIGESLMSALHDMLGCTAL
jgi:hypothetical protein